MLLFVWVRCSSASSTASLLGAMREMRELYREFSGFCICETTHDVTLLCFVLLAEPRSPLHAVFRKAWQNHHLRQLQRPPRPLSA